jgi:HigB_toxin, RelE-like toxic component of a toxin-antitoxin system
MEVVDRWVTPEGVMAKAGANGIAEDKPRRMHIISRRKLREFAQDHPDAREALDHWYNATRKAIWRNFSDLRATFGGADQVGTSWSSISVATSTA